MRLLIIGTGMALYGNSGPGGGRLFLRFDGTGQGSTWTVVELDGTDYEGGKKPMFQVNGLPDGDHELFGIVQSKGNGTTVWIDYIECVFPPSRAIQQSLIGYFSLENTAGTGFEPQSAGAKALAVPSEATKIDNVDTRIAYHGNWYVDGHVPYDDQTLSATTNKGSYYTLDFTGVAIWLALFFPRFSVSHSAHYRALIGYIVTLTKLMAQLLSLWTMDHPLWLLQLLLQVTDSSIVGYFGLQLG